MAKQNFTLKEVYDVGNVTIWYDGLEQQVILDMVAGLRQEAVRRGLTVPEFGLVDGKGPGPQLTPLNDAEKAMAETSRKIQAIKAYRERNVGIGLKDAKDAIDAYVVEWERASGKRW